MSELGLAGKTLLCCVKGCSKALAMPDEEKYVSQFIRKARWFVCGRGAEALCFCPVHSTIVRDELESHQPLK